MLIVDDSNPVKPDIKFGNNNGVDSAVHISLSQEKGHLWFDPSKGIKHPGNEKVTDDNIEKQKLRTEQALDWMIQAGRIQSVDQVISDRVSGVPNRINKKVEITKKEEEETNLETFIPIG